MKILYNKQKALTQGKHETYWAWHGLREFYVVRSHSGESTHHFDKEIFDIVVDEPLNLDRYL